VATPAKKIQDQSQLKQVEGQADASGAASRLVLTPARRREIRRQLIAKWRETFDILERHDRGEHPTDQTSN
jgi:hypothetical protein